jgi:hypothetical protein
MPIHRSGLFRKIGCITHSYAHHPRTHTLSTHSYTIHPLIHHPRTHTPLTHSYTIHTLIHYPRTHTQYTLLIHPPRTHTLSTHSYAIHARIHYPPRTPYAHFRRLPHRASRLPGCRRVISNRMDPTSTSPQVL